MPFGGLRMAQQALESYGFKMCEKTADIFKKIRKTHNEGVFDAYTSDIRAARSAGIITGLPDAYGRGRIIGDYRRVALYGTDRLIAERRKDLKNREHSPLTDELIRLREEMSEQIRALEELAQLGASYGCDLTRPAISCGISPSVSCTRNTTRGTTAPASSAPFSRVNLPIQIGRAHV